ncbi:hypothetical protein [Vibrio sp. RE88]|uniref:hypothetical protein n=1 Tax=Vibrio sp. RE88 TaxID=2607610 RepID=UPI00149380D2|nr:hypothetical protein [Vibrio sp. RE88]NOH60275.1 hypothetical protein [Vibrio sp. RE88]
MNQEILEKNEFTDVSEIEKTAEIEGILKAFKILEEDNVQDDSKIPASSYTGAVTKGFTPDSTTSKLLSEASASGPESLQKYSEYCADLTNVMETIAAHIDPDNIKVHEIPETGEVVFRQHASIGDRKFTYTVTSKRKSKSRKLIKNGQPYVTYDDLTTEEISEGGTTVHSATYISSLVLGVSEFITGITTAFCIAKVSQAVKTARASLTIDTGLIYSAAEGEFKAALDFRVNKLVRLSTSKSVRLIARVGVAANALMVALLVTSIVLLFLSKTTIWQLTILNKSNKNIYWTNKLEHGDLKSAPYDSETKQTYEKIAAKSVTSAGTIYEETTYTRADLTFVNEGALFGVIGNLKLRLKKDAKVEQPTFDLKFDIPYSGANTVRLTGDDSLPTETNYLAYQLVDEKTGLKFTYSLSAEHDKHSVPTINHGKSGWNYTSALTIEDWEKPNNA